MQKREFAFMRYRKRREDDTKEKFWIRVTFENGESSGKTATSKKTDQDPVPEKQKHNK